MSEERPGQSSWKAERTPRRARGRPLAPAGRRSIASMCGGRRTAGTAESPSFRPGHPRSEATSVPPASTAVRRPSLGSTGRWRSGDRADSACTASSRGAPRSRTLRESGRGRNLGRSEDSAVFESSSPVSVGVPSETGRPVGRSNVDSEIRGARNEDRPNGFSFVRHAEELTQDPAGEAPQDVALVNRGRDLRQSPAGLAFDRTGGRESGTR